AVIRLAVHDNGVADDRVLGATDADVVHRQLQVSLAAVVGLEIAKVAGVALVGGRVGQAMVVLLGVVMAAGLHAVVAALGAFVNVEAVLGIGSQAGNVGHHAHFLAHLR